METNKLIENLELAMDAKEWDSPMDYVVAIEEAIRRLKAFESVKNQIAFAKRNMHSKDSDYMVGYLSALSAVERMIARADESE